MAKKATLQPDKIHIVEFKIIKGQIESPFDFEQSQVESHSFQLNYDMSFNLEDKLGKADFGVEIITQSKEEQEEAKGVFNFVFIYKIENLEELVSVTKKQNQLKIDSGLANALASVTYSTARGILMTRFQGTALKNFILPVIDPNDLLEK